MGTITVQRRIIQVPQEQKRVPGKPKKFTFNASVLLILLVMSIFSTGFLYLSEFNNISSQGVFLNDLERDRSKLIIENEVWNMRIAQLKSIDVIEHQAVVKRMQVVDPSEIEFINLDRIEAPLK